MSPENIKTISGSSIFFVFSNYIIFNETQTGAKLPLRNR
jgi:hypothetical protein